MKIHIVQKGDTLQKLTDKYHVDFEALKKMNPQLSDPDRLRPGMKIKVPTGSVPVKKEKSKVPHPMLSAAGPKVPSTRQGTKPVREAKPSQTKSNSQGDKTASMQENASIPEASWSFHYPPMNEGPKHFPPMNEMPQAQQRTSNPSQPQFPQRSGLSSQNQMMPPMPQQLQPGSEPMPGSMNAMPHSVDGMPGPQPAPFAGKSLPLMNIPGHSGFAGPPMGSMPMMPYPLPPSPCGCDEDFEEGSETYPSPRMGSWPSNQQVRPSANGLPMFPQPSQNVDVGNGIKAADGGDNKTD